MCGPHGPRRRPTPTIRTRERNGRTTSPCSLSDRDLIQPHCPWHPHLSNHVLVGFFDYELGIHDGAYKGRPHSVVPFIGRGSLSARQEEYNSVHSWYRSRVEHVFAYINHWGIIRNVWREGRKKVYLLLHFLGMVPQSFVSLPNPSGMYLSACTHASTFPPMHRISKGSTRRCDSSCT